MPFIKHPAGGSLHDGNWTDEDIEYVQRCCGGPPTVVTHRQRQQPLPADTSQELQQKPLK